VPVAFSECQHDAVNCRARFLEKHVTSCARLNVAVQQHFSEAARKVKVSSLACANLNLMSSVTIKAIS
jgi:hypothetical protein